MRFPVVGALFAALVLLSGCGGGDEGPGQSSAPPTGQETMVELDIVIRADGQNQSAVYSLRCAGATALETSNHPRADEACALLAMHPQILDPAPAPGTQMCTEQYGGPATASITGTVDGKSVERDFDLKNGCGISAWNDALPLLVELTTGN
ncbi:hypothetical protein [Paeniglutamicibacter kerguelensis]